MDLCLNISTGPVHKKPVNNNNNVNNKSSENKSFKHKSNVQTNSFAFKWDSSSKTPKKAFVNRNVQRGNKVLPQKAQNITEKPAETNEKNFKQTKEHFVHKNVNKMGKNVPEESRFVSKQDKNVQKQDKNVQKQDKNVQNNEENMKKVKEKFKTINEESKIVQNDGKISHKQAKNIQNTDQNLKKSKEKFMNKTFNEESKPEQKDGKMMPKRGKNIQNTKKIIEDKEKPKYFKQNKDKDDNYHTTEHYQKHGFPLFSKFSEAAKGTTFNNMDGKSKVEQVFSKMGSKFTSLGIHPHTVINLERIGLTVLTAVQERSIPEVMSGKNVFVRSQTGSGKTLAYAIPIVESLRSIEPHINRKDGIQALIVVPTRELALQTYELFLKLVEPFRWIVPGRLCGGENRSSEKARLRKGISILIGTPGRLLDHALHTQNLKLDNVRCLVLDEADRLLDMGFQKDVNKLIEKIDESKNLDYDPIAIMKSRNNPSDLDSSAQKIPKSENSNTLPPLIDLKTKQRQTILLSATLTANVKDLATFTLTDYVYIDPLNPNTQVDINNLPDQSDAGADVAVPQSVQQNFVVTDVKTRLVVLSAFIVGKSQEKDCKMFVFMASRQMVEFHELLFKKCLVKRPKKEKSTNNKVKISLEEDDDSSDEDNEEEDALDLQIFKLHGSMDQKERVEVFKGFRAAKKGVLLCTDVAARGVDIPHADYVIQYTTPLQDEDYIHRVGRTGRAGKKGIGLLFLTEPEMNYIVHLKEKNLILKREKQDNILKDLLPFMEHTIPGSIQSAAEILQRRFEKALLADKSLHSAACMAYSSWSRYYSTYPQNLRQYFDIKKAHLGHYVTSFALRESPQHVGRHARKHVGKTEDVRLNKRLDNHERAEPKVIKPLRPKKRPRDQELMMSEFDSGLPKKKKKNK